MRTHSLEFSLLDGANKIPDYIKEVKKHKQIATAITDHGNMHGALEFYNECHNNNIKPIIGIEAYTAQISRRRKHNKVNGTNHLTLLAENNEGLKNLYYLSSMAYIEGKSTKPRIDEYLIEKRAKGVICLSGCLSGLINKALREDDYETAKKQVATFVDIFGKDNFWIELQRNGILLQDKVNEGLVKLSKELALPMVATNDIHFTRHEDCSFHDSVLCIATKSLKSDPNRFRFDTDDVYVKSSEEMSYLFRDLPESIPATLDVAERINIKIEQDKYIFPKFNSGKQTHEEYLRELVYKRLPQFYEDTKKVRNRVDTELGVISEMGYSSYFLTVKDIVDYAKKEGIPVGPGRGSAAGSAISFILGITSVDPIKHNLLFSRFLNSSRVSMPDIDLDFDKSRRHEVVEYLQSKHGIDKVANICTMGRFGARSSVRRAAKIYEVPLSDADWIAKNCSMDLCLKDSIKSEPKLQEARKDNPEVFDTALQLEDLVASAGVHASGYIIADRPLYEIVPLARAKDYSIVTQWDGDSCEKAGLVKFDLLGLQTLTTIAKCLKDIKERHNVNLVLEELQLNDKKTLGVFQRADTEGVFQCFSEGMKKLMKQIKPTKFSHIVAAISLFRPGPLTSGITASFIKRKNGKEKVEYPHKSVKPYLEETQGLYIYQEQVMWLAQILAGFTEVEADNLRKAMGKKKPELMAKLQIKWLNGIKNTKKIGEAEGIELWNRLSEFSAYAFCCAHATSYAYLAYWTAYLKVYYPVEFYAANMSTEGDEGDLDKLRAFIYDAKDHNIDVLPADIRNCSWDFIPASDKEIRMGIGGIKGVGEFPATVLMNANITGDNLFDIFKEFDGKTSRKNIIENLIKAGCLDFLGHSRAALYDAVPGLMKSLIKYRRLEGKPKQALIEPPEINDTIVWTKTEKLVAERDVYNFFLSGHPLDDKFFEASIVRDIEIKDIDAVRKTRRDVKIVGIISEINELTVKGGKNKGKKYARVILEDKSGTTNLMIFSSLYTNISDNLQKAYEDIEIIVAFGRVDTREETPKFVMSSFRPLKDHISSTNELLIPLYTNGNTNVMKEIVNEIKLHPGDLPVKFKVANPGGKFVFLQTNYKVNLTAKLKHILSKLMS